MGRPKKSIDTIRTCPACGLEFALPEWKRQAYCSKDCRPPDGGRSCPQRCKCSRHQQKEQCSGICEHCGQGFSRAIKTRFCSRSCREKHAYQQDPSRQQTATKRWEAKNEEAVKEYRNEWRRQNRASIRRGLWEAQGGKCYLCGDGINLDLEGYDAPHIEHDHSCHPGGIGCEVCRRGLSCRTCNLIIGLVHDKPERLRHIADNLEAANATVRQRRNGSLF